MNDRQELGNEMKFLLKLVPENPLNLFLGDSSGCVSACFFWSPTCFVKILDHYIFWVPWLNLFYMTSDSCKIFLVVYFQFKRVLDSFTVMK